MNSFELSRPQALQLVTLADGVLRCPNLPLLSLPFVVESDPKSGSEILISHFEGSRTDFRNALASENVVSASFVVGFHYIDPTWIPREPHAPTEIKAVFEFSGPAQILTRSSEDTLRMLQQVTMAKQQLFAPSADWSVSDLPPEYTAKLLPQIVEFSLEPKHFTVSRLMVLQHLEMKHRRAVLERLERSNSPCARGAAALLRMFL